MNSVLFLAMPHIFCFYQIISLCLTLCDITGKSLRPFQLPLPA